MLAVLENIEGLHAQKKKHTLQFSSNTIEKVI
jgi:hypothetical protein